MLVLGLGHNRQLVIFSLDLVNGICDLLSKRLVLVTMNSYC